MGKKQFYFGHTFEDADFEISLIIPNKYSKKLPKYIFQDQKLFALNIDEDDNVLFIENEIFYFKNFAKLSKDKLIYTENGINLTIFIL